MNERIRELALQAGILSKPRQSAPTPVIQPGVLNPLRKYVSDEEYIQDNFDVIRAVLDGNGLEKFAELIVRECMNIAKHNIYEPDYRGGSQILEASENYRANCRAKDIFNQIVEHFGVEE